MDRGEDVQTMASIHDVNIEYMDKKNIFGQISAAELVLYGLPIPIKLDPPSHYEVDRIRGYVEGVELEYSPWGFDTSQSIQCQLDNIDR